MRPAAEKWKKEKVLRHSDATLGLAWRAAVVVSGCGCLVCVGKWEQQELQEKVMQLYRSCSSFCHGGSRGRWVPEASSGAKEEPLGRATQNQRRAWEAKAFELALCKTFPSSLKDGKRMLQWGRRGAEGK